MTKKTPSPLSLKVPVGNLAFASNILPGSAIIYPYRYDKYNVSLFHVVDGNTHKILVILLFKFLCSLPLPPTSKGKHV